MSDIYDLADECGRIHAREFKKELELERDNPTYMAQEAFGDCQSRMDAIAVKADKYVSAFRALAAVHHRVRTHDEDRAREIEALTAVLTQEDAEIAARSWWNR